MGPDSRILLQPCFILHQRPYRDTSVILDLFSRDFGRVSAVARGARAERSRLRGVLQAFTPLFISWLGRSDLLTLVHAEIASPPLYFSGVRIFSGLYLNELVLRLLPKGDPFSEIFDSYRLALVELTLPDVSEASLLRRFELDLLRALGYELVLTHDVSGNAVEPTLDYQYVPEQGLIPATGMRQKGALYVSGQALSRFDDGDVNHANVLNEIRALTRLALSGLLGGEPLQSRELVIAFHAAKREVESRPGSDN